MNSQRPKAQLPSGLGAGGRGKEKAPCRYPHYEVYGAESKWEERHVKNSIGSSSDLAQRAHLSHLSVLVRLSTSRDLYRTAVAATTSLSVFRPHSRISNSEQDS